MVPPHLSPSQYRRGFMSKIDKTLQDAIEACHHIGQDRLVDAFVDCANEIRRLEELNGKAAAVLEALCVYSYGGTPGLDETCDELLVELRQIGD